MIVKKYRTYNIDNVVYDEAKTISELMERHPHLVDGDIELVEKDLTEQVNITRLNNIRNRRDILLKKSDWTQLSDSPVQSNQVWKDYRQALRDITNQPDVFSIVWPIKPE